MANLPFCTMLDPVVVASGASHTLAPYSKSRSPGLRAASGRTSTMARAQPRSAVHLAGKATAPPAPSAPGTISTLPPFAVTTRPTNRPANASGNSVAPS